MITLYHFWSSTCSRKVRIALAEKGLAWDSRHIDIVFKRENLEPDYVKLNPNGVVPTLDHDGRIVIESNIILEYLDDAFPETPLRPSDGFERAEMRLWMDKAETVIHKNINVISYNKRHVPRMADYSEHEQRDILMKFPGKDKQRAMLQRLEHGVSDADEQFAEDRLADLLDDMETALADRPWLAGENFSLADIAIAPFIERFAANGLENLVDFTNRPRLGDWWRRLRARPSYETAYAFQNPDA